MYVYVAGVSKSANVIIFSAVRVSALCFNYLALLPTSVGVALTTSALPPLYMAWSVVVYIDFR